MDKLKIPSVATVITVGVIAYAIVWLVMTNRLPVFGQNRGS